MTRLSILSLALLGLAALAQPGAAAAQDLDAAGEQSMLARINAMRAAQGLSPLVRHPGLDAAARAHSADMATQQTLTHVSPSSGTPADRVRAAGVSASTIAENVALHRSADEAHQALLGSDAHRANMLSADVTHVGLAALRSEQGVYVTQVFAALGAPAPAEPEPAPEPEVTPELPAPSIELAPAPAPQAGRVEEGPIEAPPAPVTRPEAAPGPTGHRPQGPTSISPGSGGRVVLQHTPDRSRIQGYWVHGSGRWWYYPMPPGAQPGQRLQPDLSVQGPPPGFSAGPQAQAPSHPAVTAPPPGPQAYRVAPPPTAYRVAPVPPAGGTITITPGTGFYAVPPPPMTGQPTRAWRRAHRRWLRQYRRWQRRQRRRPL